MLRIVSVGWPRLPPVAGTPIEKTDANTRAVFGDYIRIYDIQRAVADKATEWEMSNDEFGMSNGLNFEIRTSAFALSPFPAGQEHGEKG